MKACRKSSFVLAAVAAVVFPGVAGATSLKAWELLNQFNVITTGDLDTNQDVEGRAYVGGNLIGGTKQVNIRTTSPVSAFDDLVVVGNVTGGNVNLNNGGNATVGGDVTNGVFELNGHGTLRVGGKLTAVANQGTKLTNQTVFDPNFADRFPMDVAAELASGSAWFSGLGGGAATVSGNRLVFDTASAGGETVYNIDFSVFSTISEIDLKLAGADSVVINVTGAGGEIADNFLGGPFAASSKVLWNFAEATSLDLKTQFFGSILAPLATVTNVTPIEGSLAARAAVLRGEMHLQPYEPVPAPVPLPAGLPLILGGLVALGMVGRRRNRV